VTRGDQLSPQTTVRTGKRGHATLAGNGSILIVDRNSRVDLPSVVEAGNPSSVTQTEGRVVYKVEKAASRHFQVVTPYLVAGVKGTTFMVTVKDHTASVSVREGTVEVASAMTGEKLDVHAGETVLLGNESAARMELVSTRPGDERSRERKSESAERARTESARMTSLLDAHDPVGTQDQDEPVRGSVEELTGVSEVDADGSLDRLADPVKNVTGGEREILMDPLRDPIDSLPVDARPDPGGGATGPGTPGPGTPGPGDSDPGLPGVGNPGPRHVDPQDTLPRLPTRS
jgi:hypothetical protein